MVHGKLVKWNECDNGQGFGRVEYSNEAGSILIFEDDLVSCGCQKLKVGDYIEFKIAAEPPPRCIEVTLVADVKNPVQNEFVDLDLPESDLIDFYNSDLYLSYQKDLEEMANSQRRERKNRKPASEVSPIARTRKELTRYEKQNLEGWAEIVKATESRKDQVVGKGRLMPDDKYGK